MLRRIMLSVGLLWLGSTAVLAGPFYVGASAAKTNLQEDDLNGSFDASDTTFKAFAGFRFLKFLGVEGGYVDFGSLEDTNAGTNTTVEGNAYDIFVVGVLPIGKHFELFAKGGVFQWDRDADSDGLLSGNDSDSGTDPVWGAGMAFVLGSHIGIRLEFERYEMSDIDSLDQESAGLEIRF
jgi:OOP family OmpA-OmpF porin